VDYYAEGGTGSIRAYNDGGWCIDDTKGSHDVVSGIEKIILNNADYSANFSGSYAVTDALLGAISGSSSFTLDGSHLIGTNHLNADFSQVSAAYNLHLIGGDGNDSQSGGDVLTGGAGNDTIEGMGGGDLLRGGSDTIPGHDGLDTVSYEHALGSVTVSLHTGMASGNAGIDTLSGFEHLIGSAYADILTGNDYANLIHGGDGDDTFMAYTGGTDTIYGGDGTDTLDYSGLTTSLAVNLADHAAEFGIAVTDQVLYEIENVTGGSGNDHITGDANNNHLVGLGGNDTLIGGAGDDTITGGAGDDHITGGDGMRHRKLCGRQRKFEHHPDQWRGHGRCHSRGARHGHPHRIENLIGGGGTIPSPATRATTS